MIKSMKSFAAIALTLFITSLNSAFSNTISGYVYDSESNENLIGASVYFSDRNIATTTNNYGYYSLETERKEITIVFSFIGYKKKVINISLKNDTILNIGLKRGIEIKEVVITEDNKRFLKSPSGLIILNAKAVKNTPTVLGESDLIKTVQLLPGVQNGHEGFSGMHVRGGNNDQNLILLDGVPLYNINHFFGMFSLFNSDALKNIKLFKGPSSAKYHGRVSSVMDITTKDGNMKNYKGAGELGLISSKFTFEGPIKKDTASFILSARRTYLDLLLRPIIKKALNGGSAGYFFYDINGKINYRFSNKSRLYISGYMGHDKFYEKYEANTSDGSYFLNSKLEWGNKTTSIRWNYLFNDKVFSNATIYYSQYNFETSFFADEFKNDTTIHTGYGYVSGVKDYAIDYDISYYISKAHTLRTGLDFTIHSFTPGVNTGTDNSLSEIEIDTMLQGNKYLQHELNIYIQDDWNINKYISTNFGLNNSLYLTGEGEPYFNINPSLSLSILLSEAISIKSGWNISHQYVHMLSNGSISLPTDLWVPVTDRINPIKAQQFSVAGNYVQNKIKIILEAYYKKLSNLISYNEGTNVTTVSKKWDDNVVSGNGLSYGIELFLSKETGDLNGWISYSLSKHTRQFDEINQGKQFPYVYDRRHVFNIVANYDINEKVTTNITWIFQSGRTGTYASHVYNSSLIGYTNSSFFFGQKNNIRFPNYHRLDIGVKLKKKKKWGQRIWKIGIYNAYSRINPFYIQKNEKGKFEKVGIFPLLPYVSYKFNF